MAIDIKAPQFPESIAEGAVASWHKRPGEACKRDEVLDEAVRRLGTLRRN